MTDPIYAFGLPKQGRHYAHHDGQLVDPSGWPVNRWKQVTEVPDGIEVVPSVTNVLSVMATGDGLLYWAADQAIRDMHTSGNTYATVDDAVAAHKGAFRRKRDDRADEGTRAHTIAEALTTDSDLPDNLTSLDAGYADAVMEWMGDMCDPKFVATEITLLGDGYAGTADAIVRGDGVFSDDAVIDYKTRSGFPDFVKIDKYGLLYDKNRAQLAALAVAAGLKRATGIVLWPNGEYRTEDVDVDRWYPVFQGCLALWNALQEVAS